MRFDTFDYILVFLPVVLAFYYLLNRYGTRALRNGFLILASYLFYGWAKPWYVLLLFASSVVDFNIGKALLRIDDAKRRKYLLLTSLCFNIGLLVLFKYTNWILDMLHIHHTEIGLPPGISFYTFQTLSYIIDIYRRQYRPQHHTILDYLSYAAFFPQLIAGPIERAEHLLPQIIRGPRYLHPMLVESALFSIIWGLFKKLVCADNLGNLVTSGHAMMYDHMRGAGLIVALAFTFQIYCDFSAYTDIARGSARLLGVRLCRNFCTPYFATNPTDFWCRWHISLSSWLRDYLYIPLGGNRDGKLMTLRNLFIVMFIAGLWHGAGWFFVLWGIYHGLLLILYRLAPIDEHCRRAFGWAGNILANIIMFEFIVFGWILFYCKTGHEFHLLMSSIANYVCHGVEDERMGQLAWGLFLFTLPVIVTETIGFMKKREFPDIYLRFPAWLRPIIYFALFYGLIFFGARTPYDFIYFQF